MASFPQSVVRMEKVVEMRVASSSPVRKVAGAIIQYIKEGNDVALITIGPGSLNQAVKACIIARGMVAPEGMDLFIQQSFRDEPVKGAIKTAIQTDVYMSKPIRSVQPPGVSLEDDRVRDN